MPVAVPGRSETKPPVVGSVTVTLATMLVAPSGDRCPGAELIAWEDDADGAGDVEGSWGGCGERSGESGVDAGVEDACGFDGGEGRFD